VGNGGTILHTSDGTTWTPQTSGTTQNLLGMSFPDGNDGWAVGNNGTILHTTDAGAPWTPQSSGTTTSLLGVSFASTTCGIASVGDGTHMLFTNNGGNTWDLANNGVNGHLLRGLSFADASNA
jgi:photosystem II stability/assembly factor-like uncharacterized protein